MCCSGRFDFLVSILGYSASLANVWRFSYLAYMNGGGTFLYVFIIMLILVGLPMTFLEMSFGQFAGVGPAAIFDRICPLFYGVGYGMIAVSALVSLYYTVIIAWAILYMFTSFTSELPWQRCRSPWMTENCYSYPDADECHSISGSLFVKNVCYNATSAADENMTELKNATKNAPAQDFFEFIHLTTFTFSGMCLADILGVYDSKGVYFTALFPYVVLTILFFRGVTLDGAKDGIIYYLTPDFDKLKLSKTWVDAAVQIFFSLGPAWGGLITHSSYNRFQNDCFKDTLLFSIGNICISIFAGFVIFSIVGYMAHELNMPVDKVVEQGPGLAFIVIPDVVMRLPAPQLWSFLFFFMLFTLGIVNEYTLLETIMTSLRDTYPVLRQKTAWAILVVSICAFLVGLVFCTEGGMYVLLLMDTYAASWSVFLMAILECVIIGWIYGCERFLRDVEEMIGPKSRMWHIFFTAFWKFLTPGTLIFLLFFNWIQYSPIEYNEKRYPFWADGIGWVLASLPVIAILSMSGLKLWRASSDMTLLEKIRHLLKDTPELRPSHKIPKFDVQDTDADSDEETDKDITTIAITDPEFTESDSRSETRI